MGFDAVGWPRLGLRSLRPDFVEQGLANVRILGSHRSAKKKFDILPKDKFYIHSRNFDEATDPDARLECRSPHRHAVRCDHFASNSVVFPTDENLADLGIGKVTVVNYFSAVELNKSAVSCPRI